MVCYVMLCYVRINACEMEDFMNRSPNEAVNKRRTSSGRRMAGEFCQETKDELVRSFETE